MPDPIPLVNLSRQVRGIQAELREALRRVLQSGTFILGPEVRCLEQEFARFCGRRFAVGVASGTDALELALRALGIGPGDWVATVSLTFVATVDALHHVGACPLFVDIDPATYTMDPADLEAKVNSLTAGMRRRLKAILPVHLYGHPCDMDRIGAIARKVGVPVLEDAAQAAGAKWKGRPVGGLSELAAFSFFPTKNLGAYGDAGMVVTDSLQHARQLQMLRVHGREANGMQVRLGRNSRLDELQAAILRVKIRRLRRWVDQRRRLAAAYNRLLSKIPGIICPVVQQGARHAYHLYTIRVSNRQRLQKVLRRQGIGFGLYYPTPVHLQPLSLRCFGRVHLPETERAARQVISLPVFPELRMEELQRVCKAVRSVF